MTTVQPLNRLSQLWPVTKTSWSVSTRKFSRVSATHILFSQSRTEEARFLLNKLRNRSQRRILHFSPPSAIVLMMKLSSFQTAELQMAENRGRQRLRICCVHCHWGKQSSRKLHVLHLRHLTNSQATPSEELLQDLKNHLDLNRESPRSDQSQGYRNAAF